MKTLPLIAAFAFAVASICRGAAVPAWKIQEVYSDASGDVQFVKLFASADNLENVGGRPLRFTTGTAAIRTVSFPANVTAATANRTYLVGTANLATLYGVRPDCVIPGRFFSAGANNFVDFATGSDRVSLAALPLDGVKSLNGLTTNSNAGATGIFPNATPANFGGQTATIKGPPTLANPILFVTQPPIPDQFTSIGSVFGNHGASMESVGRGGDLYIRYPNGVLKNLTAAAGFGNAGMQGARSIAVREPCVHWGGAKAVFSMVVGAPLAQFQVRTFNWQLYEITGFGIGETPVITKVPNQPAAFNNVSPIYGTDDRIIFTTDLPRNNQVQDYPQLDEYEEAPTTTGLWSLDPATGDLFQLDHSPSGSFNPMIDSFGRVLFTRWDHLQRDQQADTDAIDKTNLYGTFDYSDESATAKVLPTKTELFPEPRGVRTDLLAGTDLEGHSFDQFFPWQANEDGTELETLNHIGRHELQDYFNRSLTDDPNLFDFISATSGRTNPRSIANFMQIREDPKAPGNYYGIDAPEFQTDAAGQIVSLHGPPTITADRMIASYITNGLTESVTNEGAVAPLLHSGHYRNPLPMSDGTLVAVHTGETRADLEIGTRAQPAGRYDFRLVTLRPVSGGWVADQPLTPGIAKNISYYDPDVLVQYSQPLWELDPVEVRVRVRPARRVSVLPAPEKAVLAEEGVNETAFRNYLKQNSLAVIVSRNLTTRDRADRQQPFNLRVAGTPTETIGSAGKIYDIAHLQIFQADLLRGLAGKPGRRVLARPMHDAKNVADPAGPAGSVHLGADGSMAAFVPARRALSWQVTAPNGTPVVRERYWLTFQSGEIRSCTSCHGINSVDQANHPAPVNEPAALHDLLRYWKTLPQP